MKIFNEIDFLNHYNKIIKEFDTIDAILNQKQFKNIQQAFFIGSGGAYTKFVNLKTFMFKYLPFKSIIIGPDEISNTFYKNLNKSTLFIIGTKSGQTKELTQAMRFISQRGLQENVIAFIGDNDTELDQLQLISNRISSIHTDVHLLLLGYLLIKISNEFDVNKILQYKSEILQNGKKISNTIKKMYNEISFDPNEKSSSFQMWVGSGRLWGEVCCFCNYIMEEIQWIPSQAIHSLEFFHGPFELVDDNLDINIVLNSNNMRSSDLRVENFVKKVSKKTFVIDMLEFKIDSFSELTYEFVEPYILNHYFDILLNLYTQKTGLSSKTRRYYKKMDY